MTAGLSGGSRSWCDQPSQCEHCQVEGMSPFDSPACWFCGSDQHLDFKPLWNPGATGINAQIVIFGKNTDPSVAVTA